MKTDLELALMCQDIYNDTPTMSNRVQVGDIVFGVLDTPDEFLVVMRGTTQNSPIDFLEDADAIPFTDPTLGLLYRGFSAGTVDACSAILLSIPSKPWRITGHSLGASRADIIAARATLAGHPPACVIKFASPRSGGDSLVSVLSGIAGRSYVRSGDPIPDVPSEPPYHDPFHRTKIGVAAPHTINFFTNHQIARYVADVRALTLPAAGA